MATKPTTTERVEEMLARIAELEEEVQRLRAQVQEQATPPAAVVPAKPGVWINPMAHRVRASQTEIRAEAARTKIAGSWADPARRHRPH